MSTLVIVIISTIGFISSIFTLGLNCILVIKPNVRKQVNEDFTLFFYRFVLDIFIGLFVAIYLGLIIIYCYDPAILDHRSYLMFMISLPASNIGAMRSIITLCITVDRCLAAYAPIFFHVSRKNFPTIIIAMLAFGFGFFEDVVLFQICDFDLNVPDDCVAFGCAINSCFRSYWTSHKTIIFALTGLFSILLCVRLAFLGSELINNSRINRLALLDAATVATFDFLPSFIAGQWGINSFLSFQSIGPYGAVGKLSGCAIESYLAARTLLKSHDQQRWVEPTRSIAKNGK